MAASKDPFSPQLQEVIKRIVATANPEKIVLFGSRARGDHRPDSDFDFLVIKKSVEPRYRRAIAIRHAIAGLLPSKDILVYTPDEVTEWQDVPNAFITTILSQGRTLYEKK